MKIAILSDIHGNLPALEVVADHIASWSPDQVVVNGDTVNRGPSTVAAWQFVQAQIGWHLLKGNHEAYVAGHGQEEEAQDGCLFEINRMSYWSYLQHQGNVDQMAQLADGLSLFASDGSELRLRHGSMKNNRDGIWENSPLDVVRDQLGTPPALFATAHIHRPFVRQVDHTAVVNSGSVGTPADGDVRASYAQITWQKGSWTAEIVRLQYDREQARQNYISSGFLAEAGEVGWLIFYEWWLATPLLYPWWRRFFEPVMAGELALKTAVTTFLAEHGLPVPPT